MGSHECALLWDCVVRYQGTPPCPEIQRHQPPSKAYTQRLELLANAAFLNLRESPSRYSITCRTFTLCPRQALTNVLQGLAYFPVSLYIAMFARALSNQLTATIVLSLFNASASMGQIVTGHLTDRVPYPTLMAFSAVVSGIGAFVLWGLANATIYLYFFAVVFGGLVRISLLTPLACAHCIHRTRSLERRIHVDMDERIVRVLGELAGVFRDRLLRALACPQRLCDYRPGNLGTAAGGRRGRFVVRRQVWQVWVWGGGGVCGLLRVGHRGEQCCCRVCEAADYGDAGGVDVVKRGR